MRFLIEAYTQEDIDTIDMPTVSQHAHAANVNTMLNNLKWWGFDEDFFKIEITREEG